MGVSMRIRVEVEVDIGNWGEDNTFAQLAVIARREGVNIINGKLASVGRVIGRPRVLAVVVDEDMKKEGEPCQN